jgi:hypothetical protein
MVVRSRRVLPSSGANIYNFRFRLETREYSMPFFYSGVIWTVDDGPAWEAREVDNIGPPSLLVVV